MSQQDREQLYGAVPTIYKTITFIVKEWGILAVIVAAFAWSQIQNAKMVDYIQTKQIGYVETIAALKESVGEMKLQLGELKQQIRAYELRLYGTK